MNALLRPSLPILLCVATMLSLAMGLRQSLGLFMVPATQNLGIAVAEFTLGAILAETRKIREGHEALRAGNWRGDLYRADVTGRELNEMTVGVIGYGNIGTKVVRLLRAFGARVLVHDPYIQLAPEDAAAGVELVAFDRLLAESDVVTMHARVTAETRHMMNADAFAAMKPGSVLVTTARGSIHDEGALLAALNSGHLAAAGLDVWEQEPPPADHPLLSHPAVIATQHTAGVTHESRAMITRIAAEAFSAFAAGRFPPRIINPQVKTVVAERYRAALGRPLAG